MVTVKDFYGFIDSFAPFCTQAEFDNSGYMVGDRESEVGKVLVSLDLTLGVLKEAEQKGVDLIITHHPVIFNPLENVMSDSLVYRTVKSGISVISAHTNLDIAEDGVNAALIKTLGINEYFLSDNDVFLKIAELDEEINSRVEGWKTTRMNKVDLTIIRLAVYEIKFDENVPVAVAINEAVELAKKYGTDDSPSFVNGVLSRLV